MFISWMLITPSFKKSLRVEQFKFKGITLRSRENKNYSRTAKRNFLLNSPTHFARYICSCRKLKQPLSCLSIFRSHWSKRDPIVFDSTDRLLHWLSQSTPPVLSEDLARRQRWSASLKDHFEKAVILQKTNMKSKSGIKFLERYLCVMPFRAMRFRLMPLSASLPFARCLY